MRPGRRRRPSGSGLRPGRWRGDAPGIDGLRPRRELRPGVGRRDLGDRLFDAGVGPPGDGDRPGRVVSEGWMIRSGIANGRWPRRRQPAWVGMFVVGAVVAQGRRGRQQARPGRGSRISRLGRGSCWHVSLEVRFSFGSRSGPTGQPGSGSDQARGDSNGRSGVKWQRAFRLGPCGGRGARLPGSRRPERYSRPRGRVGKPIPIISASFSEGPVSPGRRRLRPPGPGTRPPGARHPNRAIEEPRAIERSPNQEETWPNCPGCLVGGLARALATFPAKGASPPCPPCPSTGCHEPILSRMMGLPSGVDIATSRDG